MVDPIALVVRVQRWSKLYRAVERQSTRHIVFSDYHYVILSVSKALNVFIFMKLFEPLALLVK